MKRGNPIWPTYNERGLLGFVADLKFASKSAAPLRSLIAIVNIVRYRNPASPDTLLVRKDGLCFYCRPTANAPMTREMMQYDILAVLCCAMCIASATDLQPVLIVKPDAFQTLLHPNCSHCRIENVRRKEELQNDGRVLCWMQVQADGYINDGLIPIRFFLNTYRVLSDGWGVFVYDPDAGYARGFVPDGQPFRFHGWRNGVMVMQSKDGTLYSCLSGMGFERPRKGTRLPPEPTLVSEWGFWEKRYPASVAFTM